MVLQYDVNKIFADLEKQARQKKKERQNSTQENDPIESPEDAPKTQEVAHATSKTTENTHGGDEASKEIKKSPNSVNDGENNSKENKSEKAENTGSRGQVSGTGDKKTESAEKNIYYNSTNYEKTKSKLTPEQLEKKVEDLFEEKRRKQENFRTQHREEYLKKYMLEIIKKIAAQHAGVDKKAGSESYDKKQMLEHMIKQQSYKILGDKYDLRDARYVQFFIDTSGVYGCGSNKILNELIPQVISMLEKQGYECYIAACGNGFYGRDMVEDKEYGTRKTLEGYGTGKVNDIACPTPKTAAQMANKAEFSIILADFDGLSSICEMASLCEKDKIPYFLSTEDRYPWEDPTLHDWVDPEMCAYPKELVYDVSIDGNPTLEQYYMRDRYEQNYDEYAR